MLLTSKEVILKPIFFAFLSLHFFLDVYLYQHESPICYVIPDYYLNVTEIDLSKKNLNYRGTSSNEIL